MACRILVMAVLSVLLSSPPSAGDSYPVDCPYPCLPPPTTVTNCPPPPPSSTPSTYSYQPPPPSSSYWNYPPPSGGYVPYFQPPSGGGGGRFNYPAPPPPNPILPWYPWYYRTPPSSSASADQTAMSIRGCSVRVLLAVVAAAGLVLGCRTRSHSKLFMLPDL